MLSLKDSQIKRKEEMTLPPRTKKKKIKEQHGKCFYCGDALIDGKYEIDHIVPRSVSNSDAVDNLCIACKVCNRLKSEKEMWVFYDLFKSKFPEKLIRDCFYFDFLGLIDYEYLYTKYTYRKINGSTK